MRHTGPDRGNKRHSKGHDDLNAAKSRMLESCLLITPVFFFSKQKRVYSVSQRKLAIARTAPPYFS